MKVSKVKKILWITQKGKDIGTERKADLERIYGDVEIITYKNRVINPKNIAKLIEEADIVAADVAWSILVDLVNHYGKDTPFIRSVGTDHWKTTKKTNPVTGEIDSQTLYYYEHEYWAKITGFNARFEKL